MESSAVAEPSAPSSVATSENNHIQLVVRDQRGDDTQFKLKKDTKFEKVYASYASQRGIDPASFRLMFDGNRIQKDSTPKMLELEDGDIIDSIIEQLGGCIKVL